MKAVLLLALTSSTAALIVHHEASKKNPLAAVVQILKDMGGQLESELQEDKKVHEELVCWCKAGLKDLTATVDAAPPRIDKLQSTMSQSEAKVSELKETRKGVVDSLRKDTQALSRAADIRMRENKGFRATRNEITTALDSLANAQLVMGKKASLAQMRAMARDLLEKRVSAVAMQHSKALTRFTIDEFHSYLNNVVGASSFMAISGPQSYAPQGGQIAGILGNMEDEFKKSLGESTDSETRAQAQFDGLQAAKQDVISSAKRQLVSIDASSAAFQEKYQHAKKALKQVKAALDIDTQNLVKMRATCSGSEAEFDARVKDRLTEIQAVSDTIRILNNDEARDAFGKASASAALVEVSTKPNYVARSLASSKASLLQVTNQDQDFRRKRAVAMIQQLSATSASPRLALLAAAAKTQGFDDISGHVDKLIAALKVEEKEEVKHRDWCKKERTATQAETDAASDKVDNLNTKIAGIKLEVKATSTDLVSSEAEVAEIQKQMARATEMRKENQADLQQTIQDHTVMAEILRSAVDRMKQVYAFMQNDQGEEESGAPHMKLSGGPPARFSNNNARNRGGGKVVAMLRNLLKDSMKTVEDAKDAEENNQKGYENTIQDLERAMKMQQAPQVDMKSQIAEAKEDLTTGKTDLAAHQASLKNAYDRMATLKKSCDYIMNNLAARQQDRNGQIDKLTELKSVLAGASF